MKDKVTLPIIIGAIAGVVVLIGLIAYFSLQTGQSSVKAKDAPGGGKAEEIQKQYSNSYGQNPNSNRPSGMNPPPGASGTSR